MNVPYLLQLPVTPAEWDQVVDFLLDVEPEWKHRDIFDSVKARDIGAINRMLLRYGAERKPVRLVTQKQTYRLGQRPQSELQPDPKNIRKLQLILTESLARAFGPVWHQTQTDKDGLVAQALKLWVDRYGWFQEPTPEMAKSIAQTVRREATETRRSFEAPDFERFDPSGGGQFLEPMIEEAEKVEAASRAGELEQYLRRLDKGSPADKFRSLVIHLHLGKRTTAGQPNALVGDIPNANLIKYHKMKEVNTPCPTCKAIARYVRVPGLTAEGLSTVVDQFLFDIAQQVKY